MNKLLKKIVLTVCFTSVLLGGVTIFAANYTTIPYKQTFYSKNVVAYKNNTSGFSTSLQNAFSYALNDWNYSQNDFKWGSLSNTPNGCSDNQLNIYTIVNSAEQGRTQLEVTSSGKYLRAWMELNQWALETKVKASDNWKRSVAGHELGHGMSLNDHNGVNSVLMSHGRDRENLYTPQTDDIAGVTSVY